MKAGLVTARERFALIDVPEPRPAPGLAVVDVLLCGVCGTDLHAWQSGHSSPATCGHEWVGVVREAGEGVENVRAGDRVIAGVAAACGSCGQCAAGYPEYCEPVFLGMVGSGPLAAAHGGFAPAIAVEAARLCPVPPALTDEEAALVEPLTVALHAVRRAHVRLGDTAVVLGAGPIGLLAMQCLRSAGVARLIVVEPSEARAALAARLGAEVVLHPAAGDVTDAVLELTAGLGPDVVLECAGIAPTIQQSVEIVRRGGQVMMVGLANETATIEPRTWLIKEVTFRSALCYLRREFALAMELVAAGGVDLRALHTSTLALEDLPDAMAGLAGDRGQVKVLVDPRR
ncbi:MAG: zinc-binding dehydrogenase [Dehalococcoidia bacterium]|nr:zinc-binding dehydrogenase [Dehalococcoidia bacterium]